MKNIISSIIAISTLMVPGCGYSNDDVLNFKNSDTVIESYNRIILDMSEKNRRIFNINLQLILNYDNENSNNLNIDDWNSIVRKSRQLLSMRTGDPSVINYASDLAIKGEKDLDGKSASEINKKGEEIKSLIAKNTVVIFQDRIAELEKIKGILKKEKNNHRLAYEEAIEQEKIQYKNIEIYKSKADSVKISNKNNKIILEGNMSLTNPYPATVFDARTHVHVSYKGYTAQIPILIAKTFKRPKQGETGVDKFKIELDPKNFRNNEGEDLGGDYIMPKDVSLYELTVLPVWVRAGKTYEYKLSDDQSKAIYEYGQLKKNCDKSVDVVNEYIAKLEKNLQLTKQGLLDKLERVREVPRSNKTCAVRGKRRVFLN